MALEGYRDQLSSTTRFFRFPLQFRELTSKVIPSVFQSPRELSVLIAGGSYGCEALSFLIALNEWNPDFSANILSVDFSEEATQLAREGRFSCDLFTPIFGSEGSLPADLRDKYFRAAGDTGGFNFQAIPELTQHIIFEQSDLSLMQLGRTFDIVFCQNVLVHMHNELALRCLQNALSHVSQRGIFVCGGMDINCRRQIINKGFIAWLGELERIHDSFESHRMHFKENRGQHYFELEDIDPQKSDYPSRYSTIFVKK